MQKYLEKNYKKIILLILSFMLVVSVLNAKNDSAIFDETAHIPASYSYVNNHDMRLNPEHPPLIKALAGLPLLFMHLKFDTTKAFWTTDVNGQWDAGRDILWQEGNDADRIIFWSRIPIVLISLLLGLFIFKWTRELAGISAGLFALAIYAFDPNILGHNHFVTTDIGIAAFMVFSFYYFLRFVKNPSWKNVLLGGIFLGLVQLAKFSSITLLPIYGLVLLIYPFAKISRETSKNPWLFKLKKLGEYLGKGAAAFIISLILVWGAYFAVIYKMPEEKLAQTIEYYFPKSDTARNPAMVNKVSNALNKSFITRPLSEYFLGIAMVFKRVDGGNGAYFMQKVSSKAFPAYFPTVFAIKEPLVNLFFMLLAIIVSFSAGLKSIFRDWKNWKLASLIRHNIISLSLFSFIFLYAYISITGNLNIGFRHLFPILPFAYILTAKALFAFLKRLDVHAKMIWGLAIGVLSLFLMAGTINAYPAYMSYFNKIAGGSQNGYRYVTDSNADWGQDLKRLKIWVDGYNNCAVNLDTCSKCCMQNNQPKFPLAFEKGPIDKIHINYFGGGDIFYYFGGQAIDWWDSRRPLEPGWYAISTNYLMGSIYDTTKKDSDSYRWIQNLKPLHQVGTSIFIYYLTPQEIAKISK
jgi:hypothetical protein